MPDTYAVKRYECLFTNQIHQKQKKWQDGYLRHHHYNSKAYLMSATDGAVLAETFVDAPRNAGGLQAKFADEFELEGDIDMDNKFLVQVGAVVWTGSTNVEDVSRATREAKVKAHENVKAWASASDDRLSTPLANRSNTVGSLSSASARTVKPYQGLGVAPPKSYAGGKERAVVGSRSRDLVYARPAIANSTSQAQKQGAGAPKQARAASVAPSATEVRRADTE
ncbi:hypothetical protein OIV83_001189 [Microbotryomycetes sp. JL201]|nr:hypothetical protein OIV83_001189 [Microbotryomycetes sp. JL201]